MENLNKENYFTQEWKDKYPMTSEHFCKWINEYKKKIDWRHLFGERLIDGNSSTGGPYTVGEAPKFHDLPLTFQVGIISLWIYEIDDRYWLDGCPYGGNLIHSLNWYFNYFETTKNLY